MVLRIGFNPTRSTSPCYKPTVSMHTTHSNTQYKNESKHSEMGPVRQTQSRELLVCSYVCALNCAQLLHTILHRTDLIVLPLALQTITTTPMMSFWGKGGQPTVLSSNTPESSVHVGSIDVLCPQTSFSANHKSLLSWCTCKRSTQQIQSNSRDTASRYYWYEIQWISN